MTNDQKAILALTRENAALAARLKEHEQFRHQHRDCDAMGVENQSLRARAEMLLGLLDVRESELVAARSRLAEAERKVIDAIGLLAEQERKTNRALNDKSEIKARLAEAEALLQETCERISEAETTSSVLTGQLPEYSEGQQMLSRLATVMGDLMKRIRAFRAADRSEDAGK